MFLCNADDGVALRLLWKQEFEPASLNLWHQLAKQANLILDIGGHTGIYSIVAGLTNPKATVHTFEPHEMNFGRLLLNLRANGLSATNVHNVAASTVTGKVPFNVKINYYLSSGGSVASDDAEFVKMVPASRIDDVVKPIGGERVCVKIDTEGHEVSVLDGMTKLLELRPDILLECQLIPAMERTEAMLRSLGYHFYLIDDDNMTMQAIPSLSQPPKGHNVKNRINCLLTARPDTEVTALFDSGLEAYQEALARR